MGSNGFKVSSALTDKENVRLRLYYKCGSLWETQEIGGPENKAVPNLFTLYYVLYFLIDLNLNTLGLFKGEVSVKTNSSIFYLFQMFCGRAGGHLVSINSQADFDKVLCLLVEDMYNRNLYWIGARKQKVSSAIRRHPAE